MTEETCSIDGCESEVRARGWCSLHYQRWSRNGRPTATVDRDQVTRRDAARHGSARMYDLGCRCFPCRRAISDYRSRWRQEGPQRIPIDEVRGHVDGLLESGWAVGEIEQAAGLGNNAVWRIRRSGQETVNPRTAAALWALEPFRGPVVLDAQPLVDAIAATGRPITRLLPDRADTKAFYRARRTGRITDVVADRLSVAALGEPLELIYGTDYDREEAA